MTQVAINGQTVTVVEYAGQRVVTLWMVDALHQRPEGTARRNFNSNKQHFIEGEDYVSVCADEIRTRKILEISPKAQSDITFLTESGYAMLAKSFTDDLAWKVQRQLVRSYFGGKSTPTQVAIPSHAEALRMAADHLEEIERQKALIDDYAPKAAAHDYLASLPGELGVQNAGRELKVGQRWVTDYIDGHGWSCIQGKKRVPAHYGLKMGYVRLVPETYPHPHTGEEMVKHEFRITQKGLRRLAEIIAALKEKNERPFAKKPEAAS